MLTPKEERCYSTTNVDVRAFWHIHPGGKKPVIEIERDGEITLPDATEGTVVKDPAGECGKNKR